MFGQTLDYWILRPFTHRHNARTEEDLDSRAGHDSSRGIDDAIFRLDKLLDRLEGHLPIRSTLRYLDIGCGSGDFAIALAKAGCEEITGVDFVPRAIAQAKSQAQRFQVEDRVEFVCSSFHDFVPQHLYDVVLSHEALEHITNPRGLLQKMVALTTLDGIAITAFGPLFHSPFGDHMDPFFRVRIPWRGVLFSEKAILRLRSECFRPTDRVDRYQDISGGLNLMRYSEFLEYVNETGWAFEFLRVNPQLKRFPVLQRLSNSFVAIPVVRDYFATSVSAVLRRR
jgi:SAM-dependent methyltransferase